MKSRANTETDQARQFAPAKAAAGGAFVDQRPEMAMLRRLQTMADNGPQVRQHRMLADGARRGHVVQREVFNRGQFNAPEPEVTQDFDTLLQHDKWEYLQRGMAMFMAAAGDIIDRVRAEPNVVLTFSTSTSLDGFGQSTLKLVDPTGKARTTAPGAASSATIQEWSPWLGNPATRVGVLVQLNPDRMRSAAEVAHTLNHEVFLHALHLLDEVDRLRAIPGDAARTQAALLGVTQPDNDHEDFVLGRRKSLIQNQRVMIQDAIDNGDLDLAQALIADYKSDWEFQRVNALKARAGALWTNEEDLREHAQQVIAQHADNADSGAQAEVSFMREILRIINYTFHAHLNDVYDDYGINLDPDAAYPPAVEVGPVDE